MDTNQDQNKLTLILSITEMIVKFGVPFAISAIKTLDSDEPTLADIRALTENLKDPGDYFDFN